MILKVPDGRQSGNRWALGSSTVKPRLWVTAHNIREIDTKGAEDY